jgi:WD40 repeat protein
MNLNVNQKYIIKGHAGAIYCMDYDYLTETLYSGSGDRFIASWNINTGEQNKLAININDIIYSLGILPQHQLLACGTAKGQVHVFDLNSKTEIKHINTGDKPIFITKQNKVADTFFISTANGDLFIYSLPDFKHLFTLKISDAKPRKFDEINSEEIIISLGNQNAAIINYRKGTINKIMDTLHDTCNVIRMHHTLPWFVSGGKDALLNFFSKNNFELIQSIAAHNYAIYDILYDSKERWLFTASRDKTVKIWDAKERNLLYRLNKENYNGHSNSVNQLLWIEDKDLLLSCSDDRTIIAWEIIENKVVG